MQQLIFVANLCAGALLLLLPWWFSSKYLRLKAINPVTIALAVVLPVQVMTTFIGPAILLDGDGLFDRGYQYALLMGNLAIVSQMAGQVFFFRICHVVRIDRWLPLSRVRSSPSALRRSARWLLVVYAASMIFLASAEFGVVNWLWNPREGYQLYRAGQGHWYAIATSALGASLVLYFLAQFKPRAIAERALVFLPLAYLLGSKFVLLSMFATTLIFLWFARWRGLKRAFFAGMPLVLVLLVWNLFLALGDSFELRSVVEYFDYYKYAAYYYRDYLAGDMRLFDGDVMVSSLWSYVPRAIWSDKPYVYGILLLNDIYFPGSAELGSTPAFGGAVEQFADFGVPGVLVLSFFSGQSVATAVLMYVIFVRPGPAKILSLASVLCLVVAFAPGFGLYFPGLLFVLLILACALLLRLTTRTTHSRVWSRTDPRIRPATDLAPARS